MVNFVLFRNIKIPRKKQYSTSMVCMIYYCSSKNFFFEKVVLLFLILQQAKLSTYLYYLILLYIYRLAGVALVAPVINYWWQGLPRNLSTEAYYKQLPQDQWAIRIVHYMPWLTYLWNTQKWFPASSSILGNLDVFSRQDLEIMSKMVGTQIDKVHGCFLFYHQE